MSKSSSRSCHALTRQLPRDCKTPSTITSKGERRARQVATIEAIADYDEAIGLNSNYARAYSNRGIAKEELDRYKGAIADYDEAICLNPHDPQAYLSRGIPSVPI